MVGEGKKTGWMFGRGRFWLGIELGIALNGFALARSVSNAWPPCTHLDSPWENQQTRPRTAVILPDGQWLPTNIRPRQASPRTLTLCKTPGV
ncbi:hypothetical protein V1478_012992 [Vespula squamosa]|uniref:Uncharacterized protein n=1 Tax=Vespula squamosa TaxID=30214 RepID=A0ABD2AAE4_VESSQ